MKLIVIKKHVPEFENPISIKIGDCVQIDQSRGRNWLGDVFCTIPNGQSGWALRSTFENLEENTAIAQQNFSAVELKADVGERVEGYAFTNTAVWCENNLCESGWLPLECIDDDTEDRDQRFIELIARIEIAFAGVVKDDGIGVRESLVIESFYGGNRDQLKKDRAEAQAQDNEPWLELPDEMLRNNYGGFTWYWMNKKGFRYALPAFMRSFLKLLIETEFCSNDWAEFALLQIINTPNTWFLELELNELQTIAVADYCILLLDVGITSPSSSKQWQRDFAQQLLASVNRRLSEEWFKVPL